MALFKKKTYVPIQLPKNNTESQAKPVVPNGMWIKCRDCSKAIYRKNIDHLKICPYCGGHFRMSAKERFALISDEGSFVELDAGLKTGNPLQFPGYEDKISLEQDKSGIKEAVVTGLCKIGGIECVMGVMDSKFMMGSMGSVVGEKLTRAFERATKEKLPVIVFSTSGGARMQEGIVSLMQMAKVSAAVRKHSDEGLLYISVITDPTTGGVTASFAMLGDIILSEPNALVGFAGRRVIEQTINQKLPEGFQRAEFVLEHGFIDKIVDRRVLKETLLSILRIHVKEASKWRMQEQN